MKKSKFDLLIVGGGPSGSTAASIARKNNLRTLIIDKECFPRFHVGESLLPAGNQILRNIGVWEKIQAAGFMPKFGAEFHRSDASENIKIDFSTGLIRGLESTFQVERAHFDSILLNHARDLGAEVQLSSTATEIIALPGGEGYRVTLRKDNREETLEVPWVIDTTGRDPSLMTNLKRELDEPTFPKRMAIFSHFTNVARASGRAGGNIVIVRIECGWFWLIPLDEEKTSVGLVSSVSEFRESKSSPESFWAASVARSPKLQELIGNAKSTMPLRVTSDYSYFRTRLAEDRMLLAGDAAGFLDPVFSSGVLMATLSGQYAAERVVRAHASNRPLSRKEQEQYTHEVKGHVAVFQQLIEAFYDDDAFDVFMCQQVPWDLGRGITSIVAGQSRLTWGLWWRFKLFLLVCRVQKHWKVVKRSSGNQ